MKKNERKAVNGVIDELEAAVAEEEAALGRNEPPHPAHIAANCAVDALVGVLRADKIRRDGKVTGKVDRLAPLKRLPDEPADAGQELSA